MREVILAETAGFCFGVQKAMDTVYSEVEKGNQVYTLGPIIHNEEVVKDLASKGVQVIEGLDELKESGTLIIRSHGISKDVMDTCLDSGMKVVDATCPFVKKIHNIVQEECKIGRRVIIFGNPKHPEVEGIQGWGDENTVAVENFEGFMNLNLKPDEKISIVAQTTYNYNKFKEILDKISDLGYDIKCFNTICNATQERQVEAREIAAKVGAMIVIGGKSSSNTAKLVEICKNECANTIFIQTLEDLNLDDLFSVRSVGITAGASTPKQIIEEVHSNVRP